MTAGSHIVETFESLGTCFGTGSACGDGKVVAEMCLGLDSVARGRRLPDALYRPAFGLWDVGLS